MPGRTHLQMLSKTNPATAPPIISHAALILKVNPAVIEAMAIKIALQSVITAPEKQITTAAISRWRLCLQRQEMPTSSSMTSDEG